MASWWNRNNHNHHESPSKPLDDQTDLLIGVLLSQQKPPGNDLLRNCDLPPPLKLFSGAHDHTVAKSMNRILPDDDYAAEEDERLFDSPLEDRSDRLELTRALRLSQTRAREAETKRADISRERDFLSLAFAEEAMRVFCYRHLMMMMDLEAVRLRSEVGLRQSAEDPAADEAEERRVGGGGCAFPWIVAVAFCLGVVGVGVAFGCLWS